METDKFDQYDENDILYAWLLFDWLYEKSNPKDREQLQKKLKTFHGLDQYPSQKFAQQVTKKVTSSVERELVSSKLEVKKTVKKLQLNNTKVEKNRVSISKNKYKAKKRKGTATSQTKSSSTKSTEVDDSEGKEDSNSDSESEENNNSEGENNNYLEGRKDCNSSYVKGIEGTVSFSHFHQLS